MYGFLPPGSTFAGRYRVGRCIASGGMGAVHEVEHIETGRRAALKVMLPHVLGGEGARAQFKSEARVAAKLRSEHVVDVLDAGVDSSTGMPFLVMELLEGEDLSARLRRLGPLPPEDVVAYLAQVARALDRVHRAGIVHRDLKPENLFLTERDDGSPLVKVLDFGIAKILSAGATSALTFEARGTPIYMSPEQFTHEMKISPATDIYALGMVAFTLLAGGAYWAPEIAQGMNVFLIARLAEGGPQEAASVRARRSSVELPPCFDKWFAKATSVEPKARFATALEAVRELAEALDVVLPPRTERERPSFVGPESRPSAALSTPLSGPGSGPGSGRGSAPASDRGSPPPGSGRGSPPPGSGRGSAPADTRSSAPQSGNRNSPYPELLGRGSSPDIDSSGDRAALSPGSLGAPDSGQRASLSALAGRRTLPRGARFGSDPTPPGGAHRPSDSDPHDGRAPSSPKSGDDIAQGPLHAGGKTGDHEPASAAARTSDPSQDKPSPTGGSTDGGGSETTGREHLRPKIWSRRAAVRSAGVLLIAAAGVLVVSLRHTEPESSTKTSALSEEPPRPSAPVSTPSGPAIVVAPSPTGGIDSPSPPQVAPSATVASASASSSARKPASSAPASTSKGVRGALPVPSAPAKRSLYGQD